MEGKVRVGGRKVGEETKGETGLRDGVGEES